MRGAVSNHRPYRDPGASHDQAWFSGLLLLPQQRTNLAASAKTTAVCQEFHALRNNPIYSITSSARSKTDVGSVMPKAFAVLRLTTSSKIVPCSIGSSEGLAPLSIAATAEAARRHIRRVSTAGSRLGHPRQAQSR